MPATLRASVAKLMSDVPFAINRLARATRLFLALSRKLRTGGVSGKKAVRSATVIELLNLLNCERACATIIGLKMRECGSGGECGDGQPIYCLPIGDTPLTAKEVRVL